MMSQWDSEDNQDNYQQMNENYIEDEQYFQHKNDNIPSYRTYISYEQMNVTIKRFKTLMLQEVNTKNMPKTLGNNFKKFMDNIVLMNQVQDESIKIPQNMEAFLNKKHKGYQSTYILKDFKNLFSNEICSKWFQFYIENCAYLDLIQSNRVENVEEYITFIEQYLAGAKDPKKFKSNRQFKKKEQLKLQKIQKKFDELEQNPDSNLQITYHNEEQSSQFPQRDEESEVFMSRNSLLYKSL